MARIVAAIGRYSIGAVSCFEAAELLGVSERHFRRLRGQYWESGAAGIVDRRRGRVSIRRAPQGRVDWRIDIYMARYIDFKHPPNTPPDIYPSSLGLNLRRHFSSDGRLGPPQVRANRTSITGCSLPRKPGDGLHGALLLGRVLVNSISRRSTATPNFSNGCSRQYLSSHPLIAPASVEARRSTPVAAAAPEM